MLLRVIDPRSGARAGKTRPFPDHFQTTRRFRRGAVCRRGAEAQRAQLGSQGSKAGNTAPIGPSRHSAGALLPKPDGVTELIFKEQTPLRAENFTKNFTDPDEALD